jgi:hypothetical protein
VLNTDLSFESNNWDVEAGKKIVIFVENGDVHLGSNNTNPRIIVQPDGFLAVITNQKIHIHATVGVDNVTDPYGTATIQGIYIADGELEIYGTPADSTDKELQFVGEGNFVGYGGVKLARYLAEDNATTPGELFRFRPDFLIKAPNKFRQSVFEWREVQP